jgi:hypothetical protein
VSDAAVGSPVGSEVAPAKPRAILTPTLDLLVVGGLWILLGLPLVLFVPAQVEQWFGENALLVSNALTVLINVPHFIASYWLLYGSREQTRRYPYAAFVVPALLVVYGVVAVAVHPEHPGALQLLQLVAAVYLAWHYTGQTWGMMAVFGHVDGLHWSGRERTLLRTGLRLLLAWHVLWALRMGGLPWSDANALLADPISRGVVDGVALLSVPLGLYAFQQLHARTGRLPTIRMLVPWIAVHLWYLALWRTPAALLWVQLGHALQYLAFPARVELNRHVGLSRGRLATHLAIYGALLVGIGITVFELLPLALAGPAKLLPGAPGAAVIAAVVSAIVNVHHYFTDGCVWKLSNPDVRKDLLSHLGKS